MFNRKMKMGFLSFVVFSLLLATVMTANAKELSMGTGGTAGTFFPLSRNGQVRQEVYARDLHHSKN